MRVLYLTMNPNRESTTVPTEGWFKELRPLGLQPVVASSVFGDFQSWCADEGIPLYEVPLPFPDRRKPWRFLASLAQLVSIGLRHRIELVHANEHDIYPIAQVAARLLQVPVAVSVHFTMSSQFSRWAFGGKRAPDLGIFISRASLQACRPIIDEVIPETRRLLLYNGLDLARFRPDPAMRAAFRAEYGVSETDQVIGVACALRPRKQLDQLLAAVAPTAAKLMIAGKAVPGDEEYAKGILIDARERLGHRFIYVGHLKDLRPFYNALDIFANTSREEACSISVIEAMASGCPVVGYPSISVAEQVLPGGGAITSQDDPALLAKTLMQWLSDSVLLRSASLRARERAEEVFDIVPLARSLWAAYHRLGATPSYKRRVTDPSVTGEF